MDDWPPPEARVRAALWEAEGHIERREYVAAAAALERVSVEGGELVHGVHHLAAAGYRAQQREPGRARRQLEHARRRLTPFFEAEEIDVPALLRVVEDDLAS